MFDPLPQVVVVNTPESPLLVGAIGIGGALLGALVGGIVAYLSTRLLERRKEQRSAKLARRRIRLLLVAELAAFGPYAGFSLADLDLLETAHKRLRERWNDDELVVAFDEDLYERIDATLNQAERTISKIGRAVAGAKAAIGDRRIEPKTFLEELTLTYIGDVETVFRMLETVFTAIGDEHLARQASHIRQSTHDRMTELEKRTTFDLSDAPDD